MNESMWIVSVHHSSVMRSYGRLGEANLCNMLPNDYFPHLVTSQLSLCVEGSQVTVCYDALCRLDLLEEKEVGRYSDRPLITRKNIRALM